MFIKNSLSRKFRHGFARRKRIDTYLRSCASLAAAESAFIGNFAWNSLRGGTRARARATTSSAYSSYGGAKRTPAKRCSCCCLNYISRISNAVASELPPRLAEESGTEFNRCACLREINFFLFLLS